MRAQVGGHDIPRYARFALWTWWKVLGRGLLVHGAWGTLMVMMPPFPSALGVAVGLSLGFVGLVTRLVYWRTNSWWSLLAYTQVISLHLGGLAGAAIGIVTSLVLSGAFEGTGTRRLLIDRVADMYRSWTGAQP
jgi:hypothetical protein